MTSTGRRRIIVVDDWADMTFSIAALLRDAGCEVLEFNSGRDVVAVAAGFRPDVVLLDLELRGEPNGIDVARDLRDSDALRETLLVAISAHSDEDTRALALQAGSTIFLAKPVDSRQLLRVALHGERRRADAAPWPAHRERRRAAVAWMSH